MVYRKEVTYDELKDVSDKKYTSATSIGCCLLPGTYENSDPNLMLKSILPDDVKVYITIADIRL